MSAAAKADSVRTPDLLDVLRHTESYEWPTLPDGHVWGWRSTSPDLRSHDGFRWPWPGGTAVPVDDGRDWSRSGHECPSTTRGGYCVAVTWTGARSGGASATTNLLCSYDPADVLGESSHKVRVSAVHVHDVIALSTLDLTGADLSGAYLYGANLTRADLTGANLAGADLARANLTGADLAGAYLAGAYLYGANLYGANLYGANLYGWVKDDLGYLRKADQ